MKVAFSTLGCRVNVYESEAMAEKFIREGYEVVEASEKADVYVINTCTVTNMGDKKSRQIINRARRLNENSIIAVVGCYSQIAPKEVSEIPGVDVVLGTRNKGDVVYYVNKARDEGKSQVHVEGVLKNKKFEELNIGWFFYIGGNDSMDTVSKLSRYAEHIGSSIRVIGEPKTIDNDLVHTDHTPGFGSAAKYVASTVREITTDANVYEKKSVTIIEIMGRHAGWLTAASALARKYDGDNPLFIYLPEVAFDQDVFLKDLEKAFEKNCNLIVCVSEGIHDADGTFICEYDSSVGTDTFGHKMLAGCGKYLENLVRSRLGVKARSVELNVSQRCSASLISATDQKEAITAGKFGVQAALNGETGKMVSFIRQTDSEGNYQMVCGLEDVNAICNEEKTVPLTWITSDGHDVTEDFIRYARPLIQGNIEVPLGEDGLPKFVYRK